MISISIIKKISGFFNNINKKGENVEEEKKSKIRSRFLYDVYDFSEEEIQDLAIDLVKYSGKFVENIVVKLSSFDQIIYSEVELKSLFKPFSFTTKARLVDVWVDNWTSTCVLEVIDIKFNLLSSIPTGIQRWCGKQLIHLISFFGSVLQPSETAKKTHFYLQDKFFYIDFYPWFNEYAHSDKANEEEKEHWLSMLFSSNKDNGSSYKGRYYIRNHIVFGAEIKGLTPFVRIYLYRMPAYLYKQAEFDLIEEEVQTRKSFFGNFLEWLFAIMTSFLLVSFLVPFGLAYIKLVPFKFDNIFSLPSIILYNTFIVLLPLILFRIILMPMRRLWATRHGKIEILQAEVARDQVFLPLLREWIVEFQSKETDMISKNIVKKMRSFMMTIGKQKYLLVTKISTIEKRRRMYLTSIIISYLGVCLLEILFLTDILPTPQFLVNSINRLLEIILLK